MEGQPATGRSQHQYQSDQWSRLVRRSTTPSSATGPSPLLLQPSQVQGQLDLPTNFLPPSSAYNDPLVHYSKLLATNKRNIPLQAVPLPPQVSAQNIQAQSASRPATSTCPDPDKPPRSPRAAEQGGGGHGNLQAQPSGNGEQKLMTPQQSPNNMSTSSKNFELPKQLPSRLMAQPREPSNNHQSNSVPSTPRQRPRQLSFGSREPSPSAGPSHSPRSAYSESASTLPFPRPLNRLTGCRFETAMAHSRRRMPYSLGSDWLEKPKGPIKEKLAADEESRLTTDMHHLYAQLLPSESSEAKRERFVQKLENLLNKEWPDHDIRVHMFGSSGNLLCTDGSDVDICITTPWKDLENVCMLAALLNRNGMEKVICVSTAKVPIVKIWDPELELACDMNVNNTLALENTRMIKTYVQIDDRVRPLAMIIKHWTKRRIVNDAAFGGTLSSYTWICMIINFLQTREPCILPALHQRPHQKTRSADGKLSEFADDLDTLKGFGAANKESLGELLFQFFRFYGYEIDYDTKVVSVRQGKLISKVEKEWHIMNNNRLCVEEPFNVGRNLGNTADDTSFRGLHMELRRAFDLISKATLDECCEEFVFPKEEERIFVRPAPQPKVTVAPSTSVPHHRNNRGAGRGGRQHYQHRGGNGNRRASSGFLDNTPSFMQHSMNQGVASQEAWEETTNVQAQLHYNLSTTFSALQAQENNLRLQLFSQSRAYAAAQMAAYNHARMQNGSNAVGGSTKQDRSRGHSFNNPPLSAPMLPDNVYFNYLHQQWLQQQQQQQQHPPAYGHHSPNAYPSSPSLAPSVPEQPRRSLHRTNGLSGPGLTVANPTGAMRSHSQPATRSVPPLQGPPGNGNYPAFRAVSGPNALAIPNFIADESLETAPENGVTQPLSESPPSDDSKEYIGYSLNGASATGRGETFTSLDPLNTPAFGDLGNSRRRLSTEQFPQAIYNRIPRTSRSPSPAGHGHGVTNGDRAPSGPMPPFQQSVAAASNDMRAVDHGPLVVNGSMLAPEIQEMARQAPMPAPSLSTIPNLVDVSTGEPPFCDSWQGSDASTNLSNSSTSRACAPNTSFVDSAMVVNGTGLVNQPAHSPVATPDFYHPSELSNPNGRLSMTSRNYPGRQFHNGALPGLELVGNVDILRDDTTHLSPVYETTSPSPTASRKFGSRSDKLNHGSPLAKDETDKTDSEKRSFRTAILASAVNGGHKNLAAAAVNSMQRNPNQHVPKQNGHTRSAQSEGGTIGKWHQIPKGKKKGQQQGDQRNGAGIGSLQSEHLPNNGSERKGG